MFHSITCPFGNSRSGICPFQLKHPQAVNNFTHLERQIIFSLYSVTSGPELWLQHPAWLLPCSYSKFLPLFVHQAQNPRQIKTEREYCAQTPSDRTVVHSNPTKNWSKSQIFQELRSNCTSQINPTGINNAIVQTQGLGSIPHLRHTSFILLLCFCLQLLFTFPLQLLLNFLALVHFDSSKGQAKDQCFSCQNVHQQWEVLQSLECQRICSGTSGTLGQLKVNL